MGIRKKREKFSHKIAHKGNTSQFRASQTADGNSRKTVPAIPLATAAPSAGEISRITAQISLR